MFLQFFQLLRGAGIPVSQSEWLALMRALALGLDECSLLRFYHLCRAVCVKSEAHFDLYDQCFAYFFRGIGEAPRDLTPFLQWLADPRSLRPLSAAERAELEALDLEELRRQFEERLREQKERHDGGSRWIGSGGTSPFGRDGYHPSGIRVGDAEGRGAGTALQVAGRRRFRNLRHDLVLDVRQIGVALRRLRLFAREGVADELDLDATIDQTARNAGDIELAFRPPRKNRVHLLLMMDVGGSMTPYAQVTEQLFSAAHQATHFQAFQHYYFHNCPYENLFSDIARQRGESTAQLLENLDREWFCVIVGDAAMAPYEVSMVGGSADYFHHNEVAGIDWLRRIRDRLPRTVWLNPEPPAYWGAHSTQMIRELFPMFPLTLDGLDSAIAELKSCRI
jgi:uncharacterized protein with von Willebrand factor type A (vWA) domain